MANHAPIQGLQVKLTGVVQGVGFRPFVYRLAVALDLKGWVRNSADGLEMAIEGDPRQVEQFRCRLLRERPPHSVIDQVSVRAELPIGYRQFEIRVSGGGEKLARILPDLATCPECLGEIFDPSDRRYRYPFTNCSHCGPRFSILDGLPYDRTRTTMRSFVMCARCAREYHDPVDRRFHAQPNACPDCGPSLSLWNRRGEPLATADAALAATVAALNRGKIVAIKGVGGFHLWVDALDDRAVAELRRRKGRPSKPFALMVATETTVGQLCHLTAEEKALLNSAAAPIVLLRRRSGGEAFLSNAVAPGNPYLGVMLPSAPLHHLLLRELARPVVATSGNRSDEPLVIVERDAVHRLAHIADLFLVHDRAIARPLDDSVACVVDGRPMVLRNGRGFAPLQFSLPKEGSETLAVGAHLKNGFAFATKSTGFLSQHLGDLDSPAGRDNAEQEIARCANLREIHPQQIVCDRHPDYASTHYARRQGKSVTAVQHHHAHVLACMAEHGLQGPLLGVAWDGSGLGLDGTLWGGEFFAVSRHRVERVAHLRSFSLPGGDQAAREPRRALLGLFYDLFGAEAFDRIDAMAPGLFSPHERANLSIMLQRNFRSPRTSSIGRLFDGVACLLGLGARVSFEGEAAMALEFAIGAGRGETGYSITVTSNACAKPAELDWQPMLTAIIEDLNKATPQSAMARKFHNGLIDAIGKIARRVDQRTVVLSGGCFQNRYLLEHAIARLRIDGFEPYWPERVPINDGGIAVGQLLGAARAQESQTCV